MEKITINFQDFSTFSIIRYVILFLFSLQSIISCPIGLLTIHNCPSNTYLPVWLSIHGFICILYYIVSIITFASTPMKSVHLKKEYIELTDTQNQILKELDESTTERSYSIENYFKFGNPTERTKFTRDEILSIIFAVIISVSIFVGCFFISLTHRKLCNDIIYFYSLSIVITSVLFFFVISICVIVNGKPATNK